MREDMTNSEQLKWVIAETGRMMIRPLRPVFDLVQEFGEVITEPVFTGIEQFIQKRRDSRELDSKLQDLSDDTLLDRLAIAPVHIPVTANDEPVSIPVRVKTVVRRLSIDGILAR